MQEVYHAHSRAVCTCAELESCSSLDVLWPLIKRGDFFKGIDSCDITSLSEDKRVGIPKTKGGIQPWP